MIKNYLTVAIRNIARNKTFSAINILGLAIGMACCILILLYVQDELSYDQHHEHAHRIYRVASESKVAGVLSQYAVTPLPMGPALVTAYPEVIEAVRFSRADPKTLVEDQHDHFFAFIQRELVLDYTGNWHVVLILLGVVLFAGLLSGIYPALFLSAFQPVEVLKSTLMRGLKTSSSRKTLVVFQFVISIILIIGTVVVYHQADYIRNKKLGFNKELVIVMPYPGMQVTERYKSRLSGYANVLNTSTSSNIPGRQFPTSQFRSPVDGTSQDGFQMNMIVVDREFISTYGLELIEGKDFSKDMMNDGEGELILNEAAMRHFGWTSCVDKEVEIYGHGVVR